MPKDANAYRLLVSRYRGSCSVCGEPTEIGESIHWRPGTKEVKHLHCGEPIDVPIPAKPDPGSMGYGLG